MLLMFPFTVSAFDPHNCARSRVRCQFAGRGNLQLLAQTSDVSASGFQNLASALEFGEFFLAWHVFFCFFYRR